MLIPQPASGAVWGPSQRMSVTKGHGFEGLYLVLGPVTRVVRVTAWVPAVPTGEAEPSLHDEPLKQQGIAAALGRGTDERASDAPPPQPHRFTKGSHQPKKGCS